MEFVCIANNLIQDNTLLSNKSRSLFSYKIKVYKFFAKNIYRYDNFIEILCVVLLFEHSEINNIQILIMNMIEFFWCIQ